MNFPNHQGVTSLLFIIELDVPDSAKEHQEAHPRMTATGIFLLPVNICGIGLAVVRVGKSNLKCVVFDNSF
jgi:hypothetical protein